MYHGQATFTAYETRYFVDLTAMTLKYYAAPL